jgi:hypothetical protein
MDQETGFGNSLNVYKTPFINEYKFFDSSKFAKIKLQALQGLVTFENLIVGETTNKYHSFTRGQFYTIDDETYYVPVDAGINAIHPDKTVQNGIFLKM